MSCGIYEPLITPNRSMVPVFREAGMTVRYVEARDGHNWEDWRDRLRDGLVLDLSRTPEVRVRVVRQPCPEPAAPRQKGRAMKVTERWHSARMERDITLVRWGHYGVPVLLFPTAGGDAEEVERHKLIGHLEPLIDAGRIKVYSCDSAAGKAMQAEEGSTAYRMWLFNAVPAGDRRRGGPGDHRGLRRPAADRRGRRLDRRVQRARRDLPLPAPVRRGDLHERHLRHHPFIGGQFTEDMYFASPLHFLPGLEGADLDRLRQPNHPGLRLGRLGGRRGVVERGERPRRQGRPEPGRRLGPGLQARLADLVGDAAAVPRPAGAVRQSLDDEAFVAAVTAAVDSVCRVLATTSPGWSPTVPSRTRRSSRPASAGPPPADVATMLRRVGVGSVEEIETPDGSIAVVGRSAGPDGAPSVLFYTHHDVVPVGDLDTWDSPPWELTEREGRWYARGSADCKGNFVASMMALEAVREVLGHWPVEVLVVGRGLGGAEQRRDGEARPLEA